jgi:glycerol-3-phosphate dehydrogenase
MEFSASTRSQNIDRMQHQQFDLAIIGGGITGAGIARDAASRGLSVALIEANDFAYGTSSRSSKLIHGGIRYLENLEFHLVFEALSERRVLFEIAPTLVHPLRFVLPVYEGGRVGMFKLGAGMWLYDMLSTFEAPELHERLNTAETLQRLPLLRSGGLKGAYAYYDGYMDDDLLVIETLRSAARLGTVAANFVRATGAVMTGGKVTALEAKDLTTGHNFQIQARHFISTVGPWTDILGNDLFKPWKKILRPSKGIHLTLSRDRLDLKEAVVMADDAKSRIVFGIPRYEMIIIGTTDTDYPGNPDDVHTQKEDVAYLMEIAREYFPNAKLTLDDFIGSYAGVRPLVHDESPTEGKTSREHLILADPRNITFVAGGKYTTYRKMAEQTLEVVLKNFSLEERVRFGKSDTKVALNPLTSEANLQRALSQIAYWSKETALTPIELRKLADKHAMEAENMFNRPLPLWMTDSSSEQKMWVMEAAHALHHTMCLNLDDFYLRRTHLFLSLPDHGLLYMPHVSRLFAEYYGWNDSKRREQEQRVHAHIARELGWKTQFKT